MKSTLPMAAMALLISTHAVSVTDKEVTSQAAALASCKAAAHSQLSDVEHVKMLSVRTQRKQYKLRLRIRQAGESQLMRCLVSRDGKVEFKDV